MSDNPPPTLRVLTLNCWRVSPQTSLHAQSGLTPFICHSSDGSAPPTTTTTTTSTHSRRSNGYDVVALQEIWVRDDFHLVAQRAKQAGLNHSKFFYSGAIGSGLAILSRYPIESSWICPYPLNGFPLHFIQGDFFAGKSICGVSIDVPGIGLTDVLNTHMYAPGGEGDDVSGAHRVAQAWELAKVATEKAERGRHVIVTGDFNSQPHSIIMRLIQSLGGLLDSFAETHPPPPSITSAQHRALSPVEVVHAHGITCDSPLNSYSPAKLKRKSPSDDVILRGGKRLDYVLYRSPPNAAARLRADSCEVKLTDPVPRVGVSYSDHFALESVFSLTTSFQTQPPPSDPDLLSPALSNLNRAYRENRHASKRHLELFALCVALVPVLAVSSAFQPLEYLNWIWTLLGVATGIVGATLLYTGFVGGQWEAGALRNVTGEIEDEIERLRNRRGGRRDEPNAERDGPAWT
ncbi:hypothetical protein JCM10212_002270 [Sporobolomyces blumeae]